MFTRLPVITSKPVAITIVSNSRSRLSPHLIYQMLYRGIVRRESRVLLQVMLQVLEGLTVSDWTAVGAGRDMPLCLLDVGCIDRQ